MDSITISKEFIFPDEEDIDWGYVHSNKIYIHLDSAPPVKMMRYLPSLEIYDDSLDGFEGKILFKRLTIYYNQFMGSSKTQTYADPVFKWGRIR